jgi:hypothetical protein
MGLVAPAASILFGYMTNIPALTGDSKVVVPIAPALILHPSVVMNPNSPLSRVTMEPSSTATTPLSGLAAEIGVPTKNIQAQPPSTYYSFQVHKQRPDVGNGHISPTFSVSTTTGETGVSVSGPLHNNTSEHAFLFFNIPRVTPECSDVSRDCTTYQITGENREFGTFCLAHTYIST